MKKTLLLLLVSVLLALTGCQQACDTDAAEGTQAQQQFRWKLVTTWPKNYPGLGTGPENFARMVNEMSNGRLAIRVYGANEIVPAMEVFDSVARGAAEMGHGAAYYWKGKHPAAQFFTAVPFGLNAQEMNGWLHYGGGIELWRELYDQYNLVPFAGGSTGVQMAGWFNKELNRPEDIRGLKMRIPGLAGEVWQRLGGIPVTLPGGEIFTALQRGTIDAVEWVGPYNDLTFGLHRAAKYYYYPGWHEPGAMLEFIINKEQWSKLPKDLQAIVTAAARAVNQDMLDEYTARNNAALQELVTNHGVQLRRLPDPVLDALREASKLTIEETIAGNELATRVYDSFSAFYRNVVPYTRISEQAFIETRQYPE